jgi:hypothetical protein
MLLAPTVAALFKWRQFEPEMILLAVGWYLRFSLSYRDVEELLAERGLQTPITSPSGGGSSATPRNWNDVCARDSGEPTTVGEWTKPTSGLRASGSIYTGLSTQAVRRSISFSRLIATQQRPSAFSARPRAGRIIRRRGSSTPTSTPVIQRLCNSKPKVLWRKTADTDRYSISITFWNKIIGRSSVGSVQASISGLFGELGAQSPAMRRSI